ncbi:MaoC dehydratase-like protein [Actinoplanes lutulentus]|uniref:MaoC dehydratase-like protein n=1 Tax=Actinoplanes lutulentus TaxID=1287878 RepID=A0A327ZJ75_9ACTN|nr:MaoC/PaaZ C-terminal domain-containing protein [Actinoplanes lutulentus]RAK42470.1 MaoC dehydratase-like protein [Actinoplanes lutulentus]
MVAVVELSSGPGTTASYARAALGMLPGTRRGSTLPDIEMVHRGVVVDRSHLAAYDRVCGFRLSDRLPATYPHVLAFPLTMQLMTAPDFPLGLIGLVHVTNRITVSRPVLAEERLDLSVRAVELRDHPRGRQFDVVTTASVGGAGVWREVSTYLRVTKPRGGSQDPGGPLVPDISEISVLAGTVWWVPARVGSDYAAVSGDRNPIHTSRVGAKLFGFPRPIAHGMWTKARSLAALEGRLPESYTVDVAFKNPLLLPSKPSFTATPTGAGREFTLHSQRTHLTGRITP